MTAATAATRARCGLRARRSGRWLRFGLAEAFSSRLTLVLFIASCLPVLVFASLIYLANNLDVLVAAGIQVGNDFAGIRDTAFFFFLTVQSDFAFLLAAFVGPTLVAPDLAHGAMPLYLSRPLSRWRLHAWASSRCSWSLLSAVTWVPGLLLVLLQASLAAGVGWRRTAHLCSAVFVGSPGCGSCPCRSPPLAISAWVRWRPLATGDALRPLLRAARASVKPINADPRHAVGRSS